MFVQKIDYKSRISTTLLDMMLKDALADTGEDLLEAADKTATDTISNFVGVLYDLSGEFDKAGTDRNYLLLKWAKDIGTYELFQRIDDEEIPEKVLKNYNDCLDDLEKVSIGKMNLNLPAKPTDNNGDGGDGGEGAVIDGNGLRRIGSRARRANEI